MLGQHSNITGYWYVYVVCMKIYIMYTIGTVAMEITYYQQHVLTFYLGIQELLPNNL